MAQDEDDLTPLAGSVHMLEWLHPTPLAAIRTAFEDWVQEMVAGSEVLRLAVLGKPEFLTGGVPIEGEEGKVTLARTGVAFRFQVDIRDPAQALHRVEGVYTWVGRGLHTEQPTQQTWLDVNGTLAELGAGGALRERIY